jgi:unsaturated chondroitin disaccharide hydrolase
MIISSVSIKDGPSNHIVVFEPETGEVIKKPEEPKYIDNSATAISACGMLEIMKYVSDDEMQIYKEFVDKLMSMLYDNCNFTNNDQAILQNCSEMYHSESSRHVSLIYEDFYMLEALMRLEGHDVLFY